jgi:hypothetical protein
MYLDFNALNNMDKSIYEKEFFSILHEISMCHP